MASVVSHSRGPAAQPAKSDSPLCVSKAFLFICGGLLAFAVGQNYLYMLAGDVMVWVAPVLGGTALVGNILYIRRLVRRARAEAYREAARLLRSYRQDR